MLYRQNTQPTQEFFANTIGAQAAQFEAIAQATSIEDMFDRLEAAGYFVRLDPDVRPSMFHGATISQLELGALRRVKNIIRLGRVKSIEETEIVLEKGSVPTGPGYVHVDCSASAITNMEMKPVFEGPLITPQTVRSYQPVFSAAFIAHIEASITDEAEKNRLCAVVPLPNADTDYLRLTAAFMMNQFNWSQNPEIRTWLLNNRLDGFSQMVRDIAPDDSDKQAILKRLRDNAPLAMGKLQQFIAQLG